jgi:uncharacterized membrane protein
MACYIGAAVLLGVGYRLWQDVDVNLHPAAMWSSLLCYVLAFAVMWYGSMSTVSAKFRENAALAASVAGFVLYAVNYLMFRVAVYGTDAILFNTYSAALVLHGGNPYTQSMEPAFGFFDAPRNLITQTASGQPVFSQSYPALSFLLYLPFAALGINAIWASLIAHLALILILAYIAPRPLKALAPLVLFVDPSYLAYSLGSVTDVLWAVPVVLCAYTWRSRPATSAIYLGLACCVKQAPWFVVPFALIHWAFNAYEQRKWTALLEPLAGCSLAFLLPNLPFIVLDYRSWAQGVLTPMNGNLVSMGSGLVQVTASNMSSLGRGDYTLFSTSILGVLVLLYALRRRALAFLPFLAPAIVLFFAWRSLQNYFMFWPLALIAFNFSNPEALVAKPEDFSLRWGGRVNRSWTTIAAAVLVMVIVGTTIGRSSLAAGPNLRVSIVTYGYDPATNNVNTANVYVVNERDSDLVLRFGTFTQGSGVGFNFWRVAPLTVAKHSTRFIALSAPNVETEISPRNQTLQVVALDALSGWMYYSEPKALVPLAGGVANARLTSWNTGPPSTPAGFDYSARDFTQRRVWRGSDDGRPILRFNVPSTRDEWNIAALGQTISGTFPPISVTLRPYTDYRGTSYPLSIFGLELIDAFGHHAYITINSSLLHPEIYRHDNFTVFVYPGVLGKWNRLKIDPSDLVKTAGFMLSSESQIRINVLGACHKQEATPARGDFGGFENS